MQGPSESPEGQGQYRRVNSGLGFFHRHPFQAGDIALVTKVKRMQKVAVPCTCLDTCTTSGSSAQWMVHWRILGE